MQTIINAFVDDKRIAIIGVSQDKSKWGYVLFKALSNKGYTVYPVNPKYSEIDGTRCYQSVMELPADVSNAILAVSQSNVEAVVGDILNSTIKRVWFHKGGGGNGSLTDLALQTCRKNEIGVVYGLCPMMFFPPIGFHKAHFWIRKVSGNLPFDWKMDKVSSN